MKSQQYFKDQIESITHEARSYHPTQKEYKASQVAVRQNRFYLNYLKSGATEGFVKKEIERLTTRVNLILKDTPDRKADRDPYIRLWDIQAMQSKIIAMRFLLDE